MIGHKTHRALKQHPDRVKQSIDQKHFRDKRDLPAQGGLVLSLWTHGNVA